MRICLISREYPPDTGWGGIATFAYHLVHGLVELGHEVEVVSLADENGSPAQAHSSIEDGVLVHRVRLHTIEGALSEVNRCMPYSRYVLRTSSALWKKFLECHTSKPFDVVDAPELLAEAIFPAVTKAAPVVIRLYTPHSKFIAERLHNVRPSFDHQFVAMLERVAMLNADALTSPSKNLRDFVAYDLNYPAEKISIVPNPIDAAQFTPEGPRISQFAVSGSRQRQASTTAASSTPTSKEPVVLFVGRLEERKGINYLIEAIPEVLESCNAHFVIVGDDTINNVRRTSMLAFLKKSLKTAGCLSKVTFISDRVPLSELPVYYRSADICVIPSVYDNSPYTCLEAMSCGRAVIGTSSGGTKEYIVHGESGIIIPPQDPSALSGAIIALLSDTPERERLGANARNRVLQMFQRKEVARKTAALYVQAVSTFQYKSRSGLYLKEASTALPDADTFLFAYDKMLYDLLYQMSYRFRLLHWWLLTSRRPRLAASKFLAKCGRVIMAVTHHKPAALADELSKLESRITVQQQELVRYRQNI